MTKTIVGMIEPELQENNVPCVKCPNYQYYGCTLGIECARRVLWNYFHYGVISENPKPPTCAKCNGQMTWKSILLQTGYHYLVLEGYFCNSPRCGNVVRVNA